MRAHTKIVTVAISVAVGLLAAGCSTDNAATTDNKATTGNTDPMSTSAHRGPARSIERPDGPAADISPEITGSGSPFMGEGVAFASTDMEQHEFVASGDAVSYAAKGALASDGRWDMKTDKTASYRTRVLVRRPADIDRFSGTVIVEWLNVSGGIDANPDYTSLANEIDRKGHIWVGVSAQYIGVEGGPVLVVAPGSQGLAGKGLKAINSERYKTLSHPGDGFSFDIFTQVARSVRAGGDLLGGATPDVVIAAGESQSAVALTTYYNGVQPLTKAFDGFFVHSRAFAALPFVTTKYADLAGGMAANPTAVLFRSDGEVPVMDIQAEGDTVGVLRSADARQPDSDIVRLWEVAGASHADLDLLGPTIAPLLDCGAPLNHSAMRLVVAGAFRALDSWIRTGSPPDSAPRLNLKAGDVPAVERDADGIALGGIRTPLVDVPVDVLSGDPPPKSDLMCMLLGSTTPLPEARIAALYPSRSAYETAYAKAADSAIASGFVLAEDRQALMDYAQPNRVTG